VVLVVLVVLVIGRNIGLLTKLRSVTLDHTA
jgi:hypothetical protein